jgi:hypothetical protein
LEEASTSDEHDLYQIVVEGTWVDSGPSLESAKITELRKGAIVNVLEVQVAAATNDAAVLSASESGETIAALVSGVESGETKTAMVSTPQHLLSAPDINKDTVVSSAHSLGERGKRMRRKVSLPCIGAALQTLEKSPGLQLLGSPLPETPVRGPDGAFPTRRRSIASPARQRCVVEGHPGALAAEGAARPPAGSPTDASSSSNSSSCSSSSASSSSSSSSSGEADDAHLPTNGSLAIVKEGQRFPTPQLSDTARDFFVTLLEENPKSRVATAWLVEHGVFPLARHNQLLKQYIVQKEAKRKAQVEALSASLSSGNAPKRVLAKKLGSRKTILVRKRPQTSSKY